MKCMQGRFHVTCRRLIAVGSKEGVHGDEVRASRMGKPANTLNQALVGILLVFKGRRLIVFREGGAVSIKMPEGYGIAVGV
jgi:hypothetical protein